MPRFYAKHSPRGFSNETYIRAFGSKLARDMWIEALSKQCDWCAYKSPQACTRAEALKIDRAYVTDEREREYQDSRHAERHPFAAWR